MSSQREIIEALVGKKDNMIKTVDILDVYSEEWSDFMNIDLIMRPSKLFDRKFEWTCQDGIPKNIGKIKE
jgi:hypothetical protein